MVPGSSAEVQSSCRISRNATSSVVLPYSLEKKCLVAATLSDFLFWLAISQQVKNNLNKSKCFLVKAG